MRPGYLPDRAIVSAEYGLLSLLLCTIVSHTTNLQEAFAITASNLCAVVIELAVVDILFVLCIDSMHVVLSGLLRSIRTWLLGRLGATHDRTMHHLLLMLLSSVHFCFFFSCQKS